MMSSILDITTQGFGMNEKPASPQKFVYLLKITAGLAGLGALAILAAALPASELPPPLRFLLLGVLLGAAALIAPIVNRMYGRMDELHRTLHQRACVATLGVLAGASAIIGILQANGLMPVFSQFWALAMIIGVWGVNLMLADRRYR